MIRFQQLQLFEEDLILTSHETPEDALELLAELRHRGAVIGTDEAGTGALAGPMSAAAVFLTRRQERELLSAGLRDSKKLNFQEREDLFEYMNELGVTWKMKFGSVRRIEQENILRTALWSMAQCVMKIRPEIKGEIACVIVDGSRRISDLDELPDNRRILQWVLVKADALIPAVSAASVVAKVLRDRLMLTLDQIYPGYNFAHNKGYPTKDHRAAILEKGLCAIHRKSFCRKIGL